MVNVWVNILRLPDLLVADQSRNDLMIVSLSSFPHIKRHVSPAPVEQVLPCGEGMSYAHVGFEDHPCRLFHAGRSWLGPSNIIERRWMAIAHSDICTGCCLDLLRKWASSCRTLLECQSLATVS